MSHGLPCCSEEWSKGKKSRQWVFFFTFVFNELFEFFPQDFSLEVVWDGKWWYFYNSKCTFSNFSFRLRLAIKCRFAQYSMSDCLIAVESPGRSRISFSTGMMLVTSQFYARDAGFVCKSTLVKGKFWKSVSFLKRIKFRWCIVTEDNAETHIVVQSILAFNLETPFLDIYMNFVLLCFF